MKFQDIGLSEKLVMFSDGKDCVDYFDRVLEKTVAKLDSKNVRK